MFLSICIICCMLHQKQCDWAFASCFVSRRSTQVRKRVRKIQNACLAVWAHHSKKKKKKTPKKEPATDQKQRPVPFLSLGSICNFLMVLTASVNSAPLSLGSGRLPLDFSTSSMCVLRSRHWQHETGFFCGRQHFGWASAFIDQPVAGTL